MPSRIAALLIATVALALLAACSRGGNLVVFSGQHAELTTALVSAFEKDTGIKVDVRSDDSIVLAQQILAQGKNSQADVFLSENSPEMALLEERGMLAKLPAATLNSVPAHDSSPAGKWVGVAARIGCLTFDPALVAQAALPQSILELAKPQWAGKVAIAPGDSDFVPIVGAVISQYGLSIAKDWLAGLKRNATVFQTIEAVVSAVNHGDVAVGIANQYYWYRLHQQFGDRGTPSQVYYFPATDAGGIENIAGAAVLGSSNHVQDAQRFIDFLVSAKGQRIVASGDDFEYPLRPGVDPNSQLPPLSSIHPDQLDLSRLGDDQAAARLLQQTGLG